MTHWLTMLVLRLLAWRIRKDPQAGALAFQVLWCGGAKKRSPTGAKRMVWADQERKLKLKG